MLVPGSSLLSCTTYSVVPDFMFADSLSQQKSHLHQAAHPSRANLYKKPSQSSENPPDGGKTNELVHAVMQQHGSAHSSGSGSSRSLRARNNGPSANQQTKSSPHPSEGRSRPRRVRQPVHSSSCSYRRPCRCPAARSRSFSSSRGHSARRQE